MNMGPQYWYLAATKWVSLLFSRDDTVGTGSCDGYNLTWKRRARLPLF